MNWGELTYLFLKNIHGVTSATNKSVEDSTEKENVKINSVFPPKSTKAQKYKNDHGKQKMFRTLACKWIVKNTRPLSIVEDEAFRDMIELADPKLSVPCSSTVTREIKKMYNLQVDKTTELFKGIDYFWATTDAGTSYAGKMFIDVNVHWISKDYKMK